MGYKSTIAKTDWKLWMCDPFNGEDFIYSWGDEHAMRLELQQNYNAGRDVWLVDPGGHKHFPEDEMPIDSYIPRYVLNDDVNGSYMSEDFTGKWLSIEDVVEAIEREPEFPEPCPKLKELIAQAVENQDVDHVLHMLRQTVRQTKQAIIERIRPT